MRKRPRSSAFLGCVLAGCAAVADESEDDGQFVDGTALRCANDDPTRRADIVALAEQSNAVGDCLSDDGECMASTECKRGPEARECDDSRLIGPDAARCLARASGLSNGLAGHDVGLGYNFGERRIIWSVQNTLETRGDGSASGEGVLIDAVTGEVLERFGWQRTP